MTLRTIEWKNNEVIMIDQTKLPNELVFVKFTDPLINLFKPITPSFIVRPIVPLYVAWFFFMFRFYLMPYLLGYSVMGMLSFPLESEIAAQIYQIFGKN